MSQHLEIFAALAQPFAHDEVRVRPQGGRQIQYITARTVMNRLDDVLGPANWWDDYLPQEHSVICRLTIRLPDGATLTKSDAGGYAGMSDSGDDDKSGFSDAFKRAAVKFGIGRYLYRDGVPRFVREGCLQSAPLVNPHSSGHSPATTAPTVAAELEQAAASDDHGNSVPQSGKALFAWIKQQEEKLGTGLLRIITEWAQGQEFPARMVQWNGEQVHGAYLEACMVIRGGQDASAAGEQLSRKGGAGTRDGSRSRESTEKGGPEGPAAGSRPGAGTKGQREAAAPRSSRNR